MSRLKSVEDLEKEIYVEALPLILEGLNDLLEKKPKDAMKFLADYFLSKNEPSVPSRISKKTKVVKIPNYEGKTVEDLKNIIESLHITTATYDKLVSPPVKSTIRRLRIIPYSMDNTSFLDVVEARRSWSSCSRVTNKT